MRVYLLPLHALVSVGRNLKLLLEKGNRDVGEAGLAVPLARHGHACAVVVPEELLHLVPGDLYAGLCVAYPRRRLHVVLSGCLALYLVVALEVDREGVRHTAVQLGAPFDNESVRRLLEEDGQGQVDEVAAGRQLVR